MINLLYVLGGGAIGTSLRFFVSNIIIKLGGVFPLWTFVVNIVGCFIIGALWGSLNVESLPKELKNFLFIGLLGGFTTFSSFALDFMNLINAGKIKSAIFYFTATNISGMLLVFAGYLLARAIFK